MKHRAFIMRIIKILIPILILSLIYFEGRKQLKDIHAYHVFYYLNTLSPEQSGLILMIGLLGTLSMVFYDLIISLKMNIKVPFLKLMKYGWVSNTFNNVMGFGGFAGASIRALFYKPYIQVKTKSIEIEDEAQDDDAGSAIIRTLVWLSPLTLSGLSILAFLPVLGLVDLHRLADTHRWLMIVLLGISLYLPGYLVIWFILNRKEKNYFPEFRFILGMVITSLIEWFLAIVTIWVIIRELGLHFSFAHLIGLFVAAAGAGIISMVPGGFGSFDLIMLMGMELEGVPSQSVLLILILYRFSYFFVPWFIGLALASTEVVSQTKQRLDIPEKWRHRIDLWQRYSTFPISILSGVSHWALSALVFVSGTILLLSAATPGIIARVKAAETILSVPFMNFSNQLSVAAGIALILLSRSLFHRVKRAHTVALITLVIGAAFTFTKGFDYEEAVILIFIAFLLWASQKRFYRENYPLTWPAVVSSAVVLVITLSSYVSLGFFNHPFSHLKLPHHLIHLHRFHPMALFHSGVIGAVLALAALMAGFYIKPMKKIPDETEIDLNQIKAVLDQYGGNVLSHLVFLGDKAIFWNEDRNVFIMYRRIGDKLVVLGDPVGNQNAFLDTISNFQEYADRFGLTPLFYQVEKSYLSMYHEAGYQFFKLGEEAYVNLDDFSLSGKKGKNFRAVKNKFIREGCTVEWLEPPFSKELLNELNEVSNEWLNGRHEKGFSLGFYSEDYINHSPLVILKDPEGHVLAFVTLMSAYNNGVTLSVDLMRHKQETPNSTMDMLFISVLEAAQERGYKRFNLGMAPLANVGLSKFAMTSERLAYRIFLYGNFFYQFKGLRQYKEKFAHVWEPKYLAFRGRVSLPIIMLQTSILIGKKGRKPSYLTKQIKRNRRLTRKPSAAKEE